VILYSGQQCNNLTILSPINLSTFPKPSGYYGLDIAPAVNTVLSEHFLELWYHRIVQCDKANRESFSFLST